MDYEQARKIALREATHDSKYTVNRLSHMKRQVESKYGNKAAKELMRETLSVRKRKYGTKASY